MRGRVFGAEYLGTTQIVTVETEQGQIKARLPSSLLRAGRRNRRADISLRLSFLFDAQTGSAIRTASSRECGRMANVALRQVSKRFGPVEAVRNLSLAIKHGEFVVLLGPSGAGKTTTLRLITGLERPEAGSVSINGRE